MLKVKKERFHDLISSLKGKTIKDVSSTEGPCYVGITLKFEDDSCLEVNFTSGPGGDSEWYNVTELKVNSEKLVQH